MAIVISVVAFIMVAAVVGVVAYIFRDTGANKIEGRLDTIVGKRQKESTTDLLLKKQEQQKDTQTLMDMLTPKFLNLTQLFEQADCNIKPSTLFGVGLGLAALGMTLSYLLTRTILSTPVAGLVMFTIPWIWLWNKRRSRLAKFASQLPDALELVARALRAGHSLAAGMHVVAEEMPSPICDEFGRVYEEQNLGIPLEDSMKGMCDRVPNLDLRFFVTSVAIQRQTGGDLAEILDKIGYVIRERYKILGQVKALTAEGRLSGIVLIALPFGLFAMMISMKPDYVEMLWTHPMGRWMSIGAIFLQILGAAVIKKIVDIKV